MKLPIYLQWPNETSMRRYVAHLPTVHCSAPNNASLKTGEHTGSPPVLGNVILEDRIRKASQNFSHAQQLEVVFLKTPKWQENQNRNIRCPKYIKAAESTHTHTHTHTHTYIYICPVNNNGKQNYHLHSPSFRLASTIYGHSLGAFAKLRKATISSVMSVCPHGTTRLPLNGYWLNLIFDSFFSKISLENSRLIKIHKEQWGLYMKTFSHLWQYLTELFLEWEIFQIKVVVEIKTHNWC
jgi:hypothetical protein